LKYSWDHTGIKEPEHHANELEEFKIDDGANADQPF